MMARGVSMPAQKHIRIPLLTRLATLGFLLITACGMLPLHADEDADKARELENLRSKITHLRQMLSEVRGKKDKVEIELRRVEEEISQIGKLQLQVHQDLQVTQKKLADLERQHRDLRQGLAQQRDLLAGQVRASYAMGRQEQLKILLNQGDPSTIQRALVYFDYLNRSRTRQIKEVLQQLEQLQRVEKKISMEKQQLESLQAQRTLQREQMTQKRGERKDLLLALTREIHTKDKQLDRMLQDEKELQRIVDAVGQALNDIPSNRLEQKPISELKGRLPWPAAGRISAHFGSSRATGRLRWSGVMIDAKTGASVRAISHGRVAFADWLRGYGLIIIIDHGDGFMSLYGHNQSIIKEIGEWVEEGEVIATVGNSGGQDRSALYFELRHDGKPINPVKWCRRTSAGMVGLK